MSGKKDLTKEQKEIISIVNNKVVSPFRGEITKLKGKIESLKERLPSATQEVEDVEKFIEENELGILDFWAENCVPCFLYDAPLERIAQKNDGVAIGKVDVGENKEAIRWVKQQNDNSSLAIPLLVSFRKGELVQSTTGAPINGKAFDLVKWMSQRLKVPIKEYEKTSKMVKKIAEAKGWKLNPNQSMVEGLIAGLTYNRLNDGKQYCPCKPSRVPENICPCSPHGEFPGAEKRIISEGICYCGLFVSSEYYKKHKKQEKKVVKMGD